MFTYTQDETPINYSSGSLYGSNPINLPLNLKMLNSNNILTSAYTVVRNNCDEACSVKLLSDLNDEDRAEYRQNSKISQNKFKTKNDETQTQFDSCLRRCFVKRMNQHFGSEIQDYVYATAFEYQQGDFHYFDLNKIDSSKRIKKVEFGKNENLIHENVINKI